MWRHIGLENKLQKDRRMTLTGNAEDTEPVEELDSET